MTRPAEPPAGAGAARAVPEDDVVLRDGSTVRLRAEPLDGGGQGLAAVSGDPPRVVGRAAWSPAGPGRATAELEVDPGWRRRGLGTLLLGRLAADGDAADVHAFSARLSPTDHGLLRVLRDSGFALHVEPAAHELRVEMGTSLMAEGRERFARRERIAAVAAVRAVLEPRSVALVGASRDPGSIGAALAGNLLASGFAGELALVNPAGGELDGRPLHRSLAEVPEPVELAVIAVPAPAVVEVAHACAAHGVRALVVISAGFAEIGPEGVARQHELLEVCRAAGMRLVGPNCLGVLNTAPEVRLNATFAPTFPPAGPIGFLSQSGGVGIAVIERSRALGLGLSSFASVGDKADISGNDLLQYWEQDPATRLVLLYLESFGNPRRFARIARRVARRTPILAVKGGRSPAGARAAGSHTGALLAASDVTVDALFAQAGVIRADTLGELFDVAALLAHQPLPAGRRVAVLTNAGGPGILCADACAEHGLELPAPAPATRRELESFLPVGAALANPVDMLAAASGDQYRRAAIALARDPGIDALVAIFVPPLVTRAQDAAAGLAAAARAVPEVPLAAVMMTAGAPPEPGAGIPSYPFPEDAARALGRVAAYAAWRATPREPPGEPPGLRRDEAAAELAAALGAGGGWLEPEPLARLLGCYGLPLLAGRTAATPADAARAARALGDSVVLKGVARGLVHKTEAGAVRVGLRGPSAVRRAAEEMAGALAAAGHPDATFLVQPEAEGVEMLAGVVHDPLFGPVLACGAGGTAVELVHDVAVRLTPIGPAQASAMVRSLATFPLLDGYRGAPHADVDAFVDLLVRLSALVEHHPEVAELDCNPVMVGPAGATIVDARVRVAAPTGGPAGGRTS